MVGHLFIRLHEVVFTQSELVVHERGEVHDLGSEDVGAVVVGGVLEQVGIGVLEVTGAGRAQGDDGVVLAGLEGVHVLRAHLQAGFALTHHFEGQAAAGLLEGELHMHAVSVEQAHGGHELLGIDEVLRAAGEDGHAELGLGRIVHHALEELAERLGRQRGQLTEALIAAHEHGGQMTDELAALHGEGLLRELDELEQAVEAVAVLHDHAHHGTGGAVAVGLDEAGTDFHGDARQIDACGAHVLAGFAAYAVLNQGAGLVCAVIQIGEREAHGADVHVAHLVAADETVHGADVGAGAAAHAAQDVLEGGILSDLETAVVEEDDVHFLAAVGTGGAFVGAGNPGDVGGDGLRGGVSGQHLQHLEGVGNGGNELFKTGEHHMHAGHGGHEAQVAFVGHGADEAGFGHGEVGAGNAHVGLHVFAAQFLAGHLHELLNVFPVLLNVGHVGEQVGHLIARKVNGGHDHVGRPFMAQLNDPFAEVGFHHAAAFLFEGVVEVDFFRRHGLGLDDVVAVVFLGDLGNDAVRFGAGGGEVHVHAALFSFGLELGEQLHHVLSGIVLDVGHFLDETVHVHARKNAGAVGLVFDGELVQRGAEELVVQRFLNLTVVFLHVFGVSHNLVLQQHDVKFEGAVHAEGAHAFNVRRAAGAGDEGRVGRAAAVHEVEQKIVGVFNLVEQGGLAHQHDGNFGHHGAETNFFAVGIDHAGDGVGHEAVGPGDAGVEAAHVIAQTGTEQMDVGSGGLFFQNGVFFVGQSGSGDKAVKKGGEAVFARGAVLFAFHGQEHFAVTLLFSHVHGVLHGVRKVLGLVESHRNRGSLGFHHFNELILSHCYSLGSFRLNVR